MFHILHWLKKHRVSIIVISLIIAMNYAMKGVDENRTFQAFPPLIDGVLTVTFILLYWFIITGIDRMLNQYIPYEKSPAKRIVAQIGLSILFVISIRILMISFFWAWKPIPPDAQPFFILFSVLIDLLLVMLINSGFIGAHFFKAWKAKIIEAEQLKKESIKAQFEALRAQVNPHFIFNSFTTLNELIFEDQTKASAYLEKLAEVYRYILQGAEKETVSLQSEMDFLRAYLHLLEIRFDKGLNIRIDISPSALQKNLPPISLQILMENAIKHNIVSETQTLQIEIFNQEDWLIVRNNLQLKSTVPTSLQLGLANIQKRYQLLLSESKSKIAVEEDGKHFAVKLPLL